jgi:ADP-ribose pyrophosphatase
MKKNRDKLVEECVRKERVFEGRMIQVDRDTVRLPNGVETTREVVRHPGAVAVLPFKDDNLLLVRQYRYPIEQITLEIPAGKLDPEEEPLICAGRELREETGYRGTLEYLGTFYSTPGFSDEVMHLYKATDLVWDPLSPDEDEFLNVESISWTEAKEKAVSCGFNDAKTILGILMLMGRSQ